MAKKNPWSKENTQNRKKALENPENIIMFSCVGGTDPIKNKSDGSLLHIARKYLPGKIYIYLSKDMRQKEEEDQRYSKALGSLEKEPPYSIDNGTIIFYDSSLENPHFFDEFYPEFNEILEEIQEKNPVKYEYKQSDGTTIEEIDPLIILNISSGTPAMKAALEVIATLGAENLVRIQVSNPQYTQGNRIPPPKEIYDIDEEILENKDNGFKFQNNILKPEIPVQGERISYLESKNLLHITHSNSIETMVKESDYAGAYQFGKTVKKIANLSDELMFYLRFAKLRKDLNTEALSELYQNNDYDCSFLPFLDKFEKMTFPNKSLEPNSFQVMEYLLCLGDTIERKEYTNYVRGTTPVVDVLLKLYLKVTCGIDMSEYCKVDRKTQQKTVLSEELFDQTEQGPKHLEAIKKDIGVKSNQKLHESHYSIAHIVPIILSEERDEKFKADLRQLKSAHSEVRNLAAHNLEAITEELFKSKVKLDPKSYHKILQDLANRCGMGILPEHWDSYKEMKEKISSLLK